MRKLFAVVACMICLALCSVSGCTRKPDAPKQTAGDADEHAHVHGPHDGEIIELGKEEYHAEFVHDDATGIVTIYLLDKDAKQSMPIAEESLTIVINVADAEPAEYKLAAKPLDTDEPGKSSRFESTDKALSLALENKQAQRELRANVNGKAFTAPVEHFDH